MLDQRIIHNYIQISRTLFMSKKKLCLIFIMTFISASMLKFHVAGLVVLFKMTLLFFCGVQGHLT